jgi:hypothetical protein
MADEYEASEDKFPLRPARGAVIAVAIGTFMWLVVLTLGLRLFSPSVLLMASLVMLSAIAMKLLLRVARRATIARAKSRHGRSTDPRQRPGLYQTEPRTPAP